MKKVLLREFDPKTNKESKNEYVVASTKTQNILRDEKQNNGLYVAVLSAEEFYVDREKVIEFAESVSSELGIDIVNNIINALEVGCIIKRLEK